MSDVTSHAKLSQWAVRTWHRHQRSDLAYAAAVILLAVACVWLGRAATLGLAPEAAREVSAMLDSLEVPRMLPDAVLKREDGTAVSLWDLTVADRTIVTFYAPWCAACQDELPTIVEATKDHRDRLVVVVGGDETPTEVRARLDDLGLKQVPFYVDQQHELAQGGRVTALPTTFLLGRFGMIKDRVVGFSSYRLKTMVTAAAGKETGADESSH